MFIFYNIVNYQIYQGRHIMKLTGRILSATLLAAAFSSSWAFYTGPGTLPRMPSANPNPAAEATSAPGMNNANAAKQQNNTASASQNVAANNIAPASQSAATNKTASASQSAAANKAAPASQSAAANGSNDIQS